MPPTKREASHDDLAFLGMCGALWPRGGGGRLDLVGGMMDILLHGRAETGQGPGALTTTSTARFIARLHQNGEKSRGYAVIVTNCRATRNSEKLRGYALTVWNPMFRARVTRSACRAWRSFSNIMPTEAPVWTRWIASPISGRHAEHLELVEPLLRRDRDGVGADESRGWALFAQALDRRAAEHRVDAGRRTRRWRRGHAPCAPPAVIESRRCPPRRPPAPPAGPRTLPIRFNTSARSALPMRRFSTIASGAADHLGEVARPLGVADVGGDDTGLAGACRVK